jgi:hypothetical protein
VHKEEIALLWNRSGNHETEKKHMKQNLEGNSLYFKCNRIKYFKPMATVGFLYC